MPNLKKLTVVVFLTMIGLVIFGCGGGGGGGGGGGTVAPESPSVSSAIEDLVFTYTQTFLLYGTKDEDVDLVTVDGSSESVTYPTTTSWQDYVSLSYGENSFTVVGLDGSASSASIVYEIYRRLIGDVNNDETVNDYDLSRFIGMWGENDREGDFNEDSTVDDYDFSMMIARWGVEV